MRPPSRTEALNGAARDTLLVYRLNGEVTIVNGEVGSQDPYDATVKRIVMLEKFFNLLTVYNKKKKDTHEIFWMQIALAHCC